MRVQLAGLPPILIHLYQFYIMISSIILFVKLKIVHLCYCVYDCMLDFWSRVRDRLDYKGMTQKDLAAQIDESYNTVQAWINKNRLPNAEQAVRIADAVSSSVEYLVTGKSKVGKTDHSKTIELLKEAIDNLTKV